MPKGDRSVGPTHLIEPVPAGLPSAPDGPRRRPSSVLGGRLGGGHGFSDGIHGSPGRTLTLFRFCVLEFIAKRFLDASFGVHERGSRWPVVVGPSRSRVAPLAAYILRLDGAGAYCYYLRG